MKHMVETNLTWLSYIALYKLSIHLNKSHLEQLFINNKVEYFSYIVYVAYSYMYAMKKNWFGL